MFHAPLMFRQEYQTLRMTARFDRQPDSWVANLRLGYGPGCSCPGFVRGRGLFLAIQRIALWTHGHVLWGYEDPVVRSPAVDATLLRIE